MEEIQNDPESFAVIGAAMEVHRNLGQGFLEAVYQEALAVELTLRQLPHEREVTLPVTYKTQLLNVGSRADFICYGNLVVELKALAKLTPVEDAQLINYLKATGCQRGLLINFGGPSLEFKRRIFTPANLR